MQKKNDTVRYSATQMKNKIARGEVRTDERKAGKASGKGYQTLMNNVLRAFVQSGQSAG